MVANLLMLQSKAALIAWLNFSFILWSLDKIRRSSIGTNLHVSCAKQQILMDDLSEKWASDTVICTDSNLRA